LGTRTAAAPVLIGCVFLALGLGLRESGYVLLKTIPRIVRTITGARRWRFISCPTDGSDRRRPQTPLPLPRSVGRSPTPSSTAGSRCAS